MSEEKHNSMRQMMMMMMMMMMMLPVGYVNKVLSHLVVLFHCINRSHYL